MTQATRPVEDEEIFEAVIRRLFESLGNPDEIEKVVCSYSLPYNSLLSELPRYALSPAALPVTQRPVFPTNTI